jgi:hypothetical protein
MGRDHNHVRADAGHRRNTIGVGFCFRDEPLHLIEVLRDRLQ